MAIHVIPNQAVVLKDDGTAYLYAWADTEAELDGVTKIDGYTVAGGSMVVAFDTGNILGFNSSSEWNNLTNPSEADAQAALSLSPTLSNALRNSGGDTIDLNEEDIERIRNEISESEVQEDAETDSAGSDESKSRSADK